jgi:UDP-N-acetyl-D-mannosaminuronic acid dehydrogenase
MSDCNSPPSTVENVAEVTEIAVIGTGFVGLPLALMLAEEGKTVYGVDVDEALVESINDGTLSHNEGEIQDRLNSPAVEENLQAQTEPTQSDAFVVSVPTPLQTPEKSPDLSNLENAVESILPYLQPGNLVNIESTVPPLTCRETVASILSEAGFEPGEDVQLAHSPERILPGNVFEELITNDRVIGGIDEQSAVRTSKLYEPFLEAEMHLTDLVSAELCKLIENTHRDVNIALANEFALIGEKLDVDIEETLALANKHPRVNVLDPGIGVGGHCLPVDPWFLNEVDPEHTNLITTARRINDMMPQRTAAKIRQAVADYDDPTLLVLGAAYKPDTYDRRNSPAIDIVTRLRRDGYDLAHYDRHVKGYEFDDLKRVVEVESPDVIVQLVPHTETVRALRRLDAWLGERGVELVQFGVDGD